MNFKSVHCTYFQTEVQGNRGVYTVTWGTNLYISDKHIQELDWSCTCPHWINKLQLSGGYCKHIRDVVENDPRNLWSGQNPDVVIPYHVLANVYKRGITQDLFTAILKNASIYVPETSIPAVADSTAYFLNDFPVLLEKDE